MKYYKNSSFGRMEYIIRIVELEEILNVGIDEIILYWRNSKIKSELDADIEALSNDLDVKFSEVKASEKEYGVEFFNPRIKPKVIKRFKLKSEADKWAESLNEMAAKRNESLGYINKVVQLSSEKSTNAYSEVRRSLLRAKNIIDERSLFLDNLRLYREIANEYELNKEDLNKAQNAAFIGGLQVDHGTYMELFDEFNPEKREELEELQWIYDKQREYPPEVDIWTNNTHIDFGGK